jgi:hypothetical protein
VKEIVRQGKTKYAAHCSECSCDFTYERSDVRHNYVRGSDEVTCPGCGHGIRHFGESGTRWPTGGTSLHWASCARVRAERTAHE